MEFYRVEPSARTSWRLAVLMGANSRTYKFALAQALLELSRDGRDTVPLKELAVAYSRALLARTNGFPQAPAAGDLGPNDFLSVLAEETEPSIALGGPTERLVDAAAASMPGMVMRKFHNLRSTDGVAHEFYRVHGRGADQAVEFTPALTDLATAGTATSLAYELDARWSLVEASFDAHIGRSLVTTGVLLDPNGEFLLDQIHRAPVATSRSALVGFQHGRCFYCHAPLDTDTWVNAHVDHVFPFSAMLTGSWQGPDLNGVWNLVVACAPCNARKGARFPTPAELALLCERNEAILASPHPLRRTIELLVRPPGYRGRTDASGRRAFYQSVDRYIREGGRFTDLAAGQTVGPPGVDLPLR